MPLGNGDKPVKKERRCSRDELERVYEWYRWIGYDPSEELDEYEEDSDAQETI